MGATSQPEYESSPDVAVDGSVQNSEVSDDDNSSKSEASTLLSGLVNRFRATLLAPVGLFHRYLIPILAFALVFGAALYFLANL